MNQLGITHFGLWIVRFIRIQLFMTLISFPILVTWGLPISLLSLLGNLIFSPFLMLFLLLCSLVFFCELLGIPPTLFIYLLEYVGSWWYWLLALPNNYFLIGFAQPPLLILMLLPFCIFITLYCKKTRALFPSTLIFSILLCVTFLLCHLRVYSSCKIEKIPCNNGYVTLINTNNKLVLIDPGVIGQRISACAWIEYTLIPHIIKTTGKTSIDHVIILQPNKMIFDAALVLCTKMNVKKLYLPLWQGNCAKSSWRSFFKLKEACTKDSLIRLATIPISFMLNKNSSIIIEPLEHIIKKTEIHYQAYKVEWIIEGDTNMIKHLYSTAYKHLSLCKLDNEQ